MSSKSDANAVIIKIAYNENPARVSRGLAYEFRSRLDVFIRYVVDNDRIDARF